MGLPYSSPAVIDTQCCIIKYDNAYSYTFKTAPSIIARLHNRDASADFSGLKLVIVSTET